MSITAEYEKRCKEIPGKALDVFVKQGFENTTFQKIAARHYPYKPIHLFQE
jgi:hypothetical protein